MVNIKPLTFADLQDWCRKIKRLLNSFMLLSKADPSSVFRVLSPGVQRSNKTRQSAVRG